MINRDQMKELVDLVETWNVQKQLGRDFTTGDMNKFAELMNNRTRHLISLFEINNPEFYTGLFELAQHACSMTTPGSKLFVDGQDQTNR
jgi:hypothetical protein